jgi:hypothetical protein
LRGDKGTTFLAASKSFLYLLNKRKSSESIVILRILAPANKKHRYPPVYQGRVLLIINKSKTTEMGLSKTKVCGLLLVTVAFVAMGACKPKTAATEVPAEEVESVDSMTCTEGAEHDSTCCGEAHSDEAAPAGEATVQ